MSVSETDGYQFKIADQGRFNAGYWDACVAIQQGWDRNGKCFEGRFCSPVPFSLVTEPETVVARHFDKVYAWGWYYGYWACRRGSQGDSSLPSWEEAKKAGRV